MITLTSIGEPLIAQMISRSKAVRHLLAKTVPSARLTVDTLKVVDEVPLGRCGEHRFDGAHKLDVALFIPETTKCLGIEAKLGFDRLNKQEFEKRFLQPCRTSHGDTRVAGSMIAILEGKMPPALEGKPVSVRHADLDYLLYHEWVLIVRQETLQGWTPDQRPDFTTRCIPLAFESIVDTYGGRDQFNALVSELIGGDYYHEWMGRPK